MNKFLLFMASLFFLSCSSNKVITYSIFVSDDVPLMTYYNYLYAEDEQKKDYRYYGYVNEDTFDVVIPAQYDAALPFVGNFAIVQDEKKRIFVINKRNEKIFSMEHTVDFSRIYKMEKSDTHLLLTVEYGGISSIEGRGLSLNPLVERPHIVVAKVFNLSTGKQVFIKTALFKYWGWKKPKLLLVDDYVIFQQEADYIFIDGEPVNTGTFVLKMNGKGKLEECTITAEELIMQIAEKRNMVPKDYKTYINTTSGIKYFFNSSKSFTYNNPESPAYFDYYFGFVDRIDSDIFLKNIPKNMYIKNSAFTLDSFPEGTTIEDLKAAGYSVGRLVNKHEYEMYPVNRKEEYPLQEDFSLYGVSLRSVMPENKESIFYGLYDSMENKWVILPIPREFHSTHYKNFVGSGKNVFFNIKTRKKYTNVFKEQENRLTFPYMVYYGHYINDYEKRNNKEYIKWYIEDF